MIPATPNNDSMTSIASSSSQAAALIREPTIRALMKYSSLWMTTRKTSDHTATSSEAPGGQNSLGGVAQALV